MLQDFLKKLGVKSYDELNPEEKATYKQWEEALSGRKLTDKDVQEWLERELSEAVTHVTETNLSEEDEIFRKMEIRFIKKITNFLNSPLVEKQMAEKSMEQLMKT